MRTLVISDIHLGDERFNGLDALMDLLLTETYDQLILNGDIFDWWVGFKVIDQTFLDLLNTLAATKTIIYILGNHDYCITQYLQPLAPQILITEFYELISGGKRFLILHGNQAYRRKDESIWLRLLAKLNYSIWQHLGVDLQRMNDCSEYYARYIARKRERLVRKYGAGFDALITGHTHSVGHCVVGGVELFDIGGFVKTKSYAIIEDAIVTIGVKI